MTAEQDILTFVCVWHVLTVEMQQRLLTQLLNCSRHRLYATLPSQARGNYKKVQLEDLSHFLSILPENSVLTPEQNGDVLAKYNTDWMQKYKGNAATVLLPTNTTQVAQILKHCHEQK